MTNEINSLIDELGNFCKQHKLTIVTAESCTGGGIAYMLSKSRITSSILERGYVTYSHQSKQRLLHVNSQTLQTQGAVSKEVAEAMSRGALENSIAQVSLAVTGIAGEDNDAIHDVGRAWISVTIIDNKTFTKEFIFTGSRIDFIEYMIQTSILFLSECLINIFN